MGLGRELAAALLLAVCALPVCLPLWAQRRMTAAELEQDLAAMQHKKEREIVRELSEVVLTERLSTLELERLQRGLKGEAARNALLEVADTSAFLSPPASEIVAQAAPDREAQKRMVAAAISYAESAMHRMPNLTATKLTTRFEGAPEAPDWLSKYEPLRIRGRSSATAFYLGGNEVADPNGKGAKKIDASAASLEASLDSKGEFGPIHNMVLADASHGTLRWLRWERNAGGGGLSDAAHTDGAKLLSVFRYDVPKDKSHYEMNYCCVPGGKNGDTLVPFHQVTGYFGEIALDPADGTVLRLTVETELGLESPLSRTATLVEYGPVELEGKTYICPRKSLSMTRVATMTFEKKTRTWDAVGVDTQRQTLLNDTVFDHYRRFGSESTVVFGP